MTKYILTAIFIHVFIFGLLLCFGNGPSEEIYYLFFPETETEQYEHEDPNQLEKPDTEKQPNQDEKETNTKLGQVHLYAGATQELRQTLLDRGTKGPGAESTSSVTTVSKPKREQENKLPPADYDQEGEVAPCVRIQPFPGNQFNQLIVTGHAIVAIYVDKRTIATDGERTEFLKEGGIWGDAVYSKRTLEPDKMSTTIRALRMELERKAASYGFAKYLVEEAPVRILIRVEFDNHILKTQENAARENGVQFQNVERTVGHLNLSSSHVQYVVTALHMKDGRRIEVKS